MQFTTQLLDQLTAQAKASPRLRQNYDLRNSEKDLSQRMLNAMEPGTELPIHRHLSSSETLVVVRGKIRNNIYELETLPDGTRIPRLVEQYVVEAGGEIMGFSVSAGVWHRAESLESGTVILECKDGAWQPLTEDEVL